MGEERQEAQKRSVYSVITGDSSLPPEPFLITARAPSTTHFTVSFTLIG